MSGLHGNHRVIALIDMDCFYVQVEQRENPELWGKPVAVVQYNQWKGGGLIAVGYEARSAGVKRGSMRGEEAMRLCPELTLCSVPTSRGKADLTKYRDASAEVFQVLNNFDAQITVERASVDEAYLDMTKLVNARHKDTNYVILPQDLQSTFIISEDPTVNVQTWLNNLSRDSTDWRLAVGAVIVEQIRARVHRDTQFYCSAGIANGKTLAKLVCAKNKPRKQTVLPLSQIQNLFKSVAIDSVRNLGGKLGQTLMNNNHLKTMHDLAQMSKEYLYRQFNPKIAQWLHDLSHGLDTELVISRDLAKSIGCSKNFYGHLALKTKTELKKWLRFLCEELNERLTKDQIENSRTARKLVVGLRNGSNIGHSDEFNKSSTRQTPIVSYKVEALFNLAYQLFSEFNTGKTDTDIWSPAVINLSIGAGNFEDCIDVESHSITQFFTPKPPVLRPSKLASLPSELGLVHKAKSGGCPVNHKHMLHKENSQDTNGYASKTTANDICDSAVTTDEEDMFPSDDDNDVCYTNVHVEQPSTSGAQDSSVQLMGPSTSGAQDSSVQLMGPSTSGAQDSSVQLMGPSTSGAQDSSVQLMGPSTSGAQESSVQLIEPNEKTIPVFEPTKYVPKSLESIDKNTFKALPRELQLELTGIFREQNKTAVNSNKTALIGKPKKPSPKKRKLSQVPKNNAKIGDFFSKS